MHRRESPPSLLVYHADRRKCPNKRSRRLHDGPQAPMDNSQGTLHRVEQNDAEFMQLQIGYPSFDGGFKSSDASDYSRLGTAIGNNNHLKTLEFRMDNEDQLDAANTEFFNGLKRNASINNLELRCNQHTLVGGIGQIILESYQKNNNNLIRLCITDAVLDNGGDNVITETLRWCTNLKSINLGSNNITDEQLLPIVEAIKGGCYTSLESLILYGNRIGNAGCEALVTLIADTNCNLKLLNLDSNQIGNEGATVIANTMANNNKLIRLDLEEKPIDASAVGIFCTVLCNTSSVNDTYHSNHTLNTLVLSDEQEGQRVDLLSALLNMNEEKNKSHVAIRKILKHHPNIDMKPLFEWDSRWGTNSEGIASCY